MALAICVFDALSTTMKQSLFSRAIWSKVLSVTYGLMTTFCASSSLNLHSLPLCPSRAEDLDRRGRPQREPSRHPSWREREHAEVVDGSHLDPGDGLRRLPDAPVVTHDDERPDLLPCGPSPHPRGPRAPLHPAVDSPHLIGEAQDLEERLQRGRLLEGLQLVGDHQGEFQLPGLVAPPGDRVAVARERDGRVEGELPLLDVYLPVDHFLRPRRVRQPPLHRAGDASPLAGPVGPAALDPRDPRDSSSGRRVAGLGARPLARHGVAPVRLEAVRVEYPPGPLYDVRPERCGEHGGELNLVARLAARVEDLHRVRHPLLPACYPRANF